MKNRDLMVIFFLITGISCVITGILSMYVDILSSWRYSVLCYISFGFFVVFGYMIFSDSSWYIMPVKVSQTKIASMPVANTQSATKSTSSKAVIINKIEKSKISKQKTRKSAKK